MRSLEELCHVWLLLQQSSKISKLWLILDTTRPPRVLEENGQSYWFTDRESMEEDIKHSKFLEYGEYNGHLYGTHLDSIRDVIKQVKQQQTCSRKFLNRLFSGENVCIGL